MQHVGLESMDACGGQREARNGPLRVSLDGQWQRGSQGGVSVQTEGHLRQP